MFNIILAQLEGGGWIVEAAVREMLKGQRNEFALAVLSPDDSSRVVVRHILRLVNDKRLDHFLQQLEPTPLNVATSALFVRRNEAVINGCVQRLVFDQGPASTAQVLAGLLPCFEGLGYQVPLAVPHGAPTHAHSSCGLQLSLGLRRIARRRFDRTEHYRAVDPASRLVLDHITKLAQADAAASHVSAEDFVGATAEMVLDEVCHSSSELDDAELMAFLTTTEKLANNLLQDPAKVQSLPHSPPCASHSFQHLQPKYQSLNLSSAGLHRKVGRFPAGVALVHLLGYALAEPEDERLTLTQVDPALIAIVHDKVATALATVKGERPPRHTFRRRRGPGGEGAILELLSAAGNEFL